MKGVLLSAFLFVALVCLLMIAACGPSPNTNVNSNANGGSGNVNKTPEATPIVTKCSVEDNKALIDEIGAGVTANIADRKLKLNWDATDCVVSLTGAAGSLQNFKALEKYAFNSTHFRGMQNEHLFIVDAEADLSMDGCSSDWKKCGDICIPPNETCNNGGPTILGTGTPVKTP